MIAQWKRTFALWRRQRVSRAFAPGTIVRDRYTILEPLGEGSYGVAYLCRMMHTMHTDHPLCVLKRMHPLRGGAARRQALLIQETRMLSRLQHPAIPTLHEHFDHRGFPCFTMSFASGTSLERMLFVDERVFTPSESLAMLLRILDIVAYVHSQGVVHRDIRIGNVIVDGERVHLVDFGLARELGAGPTNADRDENALDDDPMERKLRRSLSFTSDFYALGHLLLFLLYSGYVKEGIERGWEEELTDLHPQTRRLLRRMLQAEQPYTHIRDVIADATSAWEAVNA
jgi:serine/threonine-protein kinase